MVKKPSKKIDEFLAAPDEVAKDPEERAKYRERRLRDEARKKRLARSKRKTVPSQEDLLNDIVRVAEDPDTNPLGHNTRSISRARYEVWGWYPVEHVDARFGTFARALETAGLRNRPGSMLWRANRAREHREEHTARYYRKYIEPYVVNRDDFRKISGDRYLLLSISDTHSTMLCPFVWLAFLFAIKELKPDGVLFNGDTIDGSSISRHAKIKGYVPPLALELAIQRSMMADVRKIGHQGDIFHTCGNHDLAARLPHYFAHQDASLLEVVEATHGHRRVDEMMGLQDYDVKLFHGGSPLSPRGQEDAKTGFIMFDHYRIHHGTKLGQVPSLAELRAVGYSGQSGHVHRASLVYGTTERDSGLSWMSTPMGARYEVGRAYIPGPSTGWQKGFGVAWLHPDGHVHQYPVVVGGRQESVAFEGYNLTRADSMKDPSPDVDWLKDYDIPGMVI